jgi:hypothetical protein
LIHTTDLKGITEARYNNILAGCAKISTSGQGQFKTGKEASAEHMTRFRVSTGKKRK